MDIYKDEDSIFKSENSNNTVVNSQAKFQLEPFQKTFRGLIAASNQIINDVL